MLVATLDVAGFDSNGPKLIAFIAAYAALTLLIIFGVRTVKLILDADPTIARTALTEPGTPITPISPPAQPPAGAAGQQAAGGAGANQANASGAGEDGSDGSASSDKGSFSRVAGAFGAMILCAIIAALSYWVIFALFYTKDSLMTHLQGIGTFMMSAASIFAPYAVNQLTSIFKA